MSQILTVEEGASAIIDCIQNALLSDQGALIGRNGTIELSCILQPALTVEDPRLQILDRNAGIFPSRDFNSFLKWKEETTNAILNADVLAAGWYAPLAKEEAERFNQWSITATRVPLRSLEPYYVQYPLQWTSLLKGYTVAVVSSFCRSAQSQVRKSPNTLWNNHFHFPSENEWVWIQTGHPPSIANGRNEWDSTVFSWETAVESMMQKVIESGARFALIGCGGLGMPLAHKLKERGIICIVMGGAIQVLFGIKGRRWASHDIISSFWNDEWVWPLKEETPLNASHIEGGCYW